jgi:hypothetical protein
MNHLTSRSAAPQAELEVKSLDNQAAVDGWVDKASARSGVKFAPK